MRCHACLAALLLGLMPCPPVQAQSTQAAPHACTIPHGPLALWALAQCCAADLHGNPSCRVHDAADDFVVIKDNAKSKPSAYLIIPTIRVTGIEDAQIFAAPVLNFWRYGWDEAQRLVGEPAADMALAINSIHARSQNQLHIHIACVRPDVATTLAANAGRIGDDPAHPVTLALGPRGNPYDAVTTTQLTGDASPFDMAARMPGARSHMGDWSIAVVGTPTPGRYDVLATWAHGTDYGAAEELLDQTCAVHPTP